MTIEELEAKGYKFTVRHHRREVEVRIDVRIDKAIIHRFDPTLVGVCAANYRTDAMEAARVRACGHYVEQRLEQ